MTRETYTNPNHKIMATINKLGDIYRIVWDEINNIFYIVDADGYVNQESVFLTRYKAERFIINHDLKRSRWKGTDYSK